MTAFFPEVMYEGLSWRWVEAQSKDSDRANLINKGMAARIQLVQVSV